MVTNTDDSDTDFQSAYSTSPRGSYGSFGSGQGHAYPEDDDDRTNVQDDFDQHLPSFSKTRRERVSSTATAISPRDHPEPSPTFSEDTVISQSRDPAKHT